LFTDRTEMSRGPGLKDRSTESVQVEHGVKLELSGLEEVFLLQTVGRYLKGGSKSPLRFTKNPELCHGAVTFWGVIAQDGAVGGIFNVDRCLSDRSGIEDFWTHIVSKRQLNPASQSGDNHSRHRRLLLLLESRTVAEKARQIVGHTPDYIGYNFSRDIAIASGILEIGRVKEQEPSYSVWIYMGYIPQILDSDRWLLAELSADEESSWTLASVLRDLHEGTGDPVGYWRERRVEEIERERLDVDLEYVEEEQGEEVKEEGQEEADTDVEELEEAAGEDSAGTEAQVES
jgi:hypothetical protein